MVGIEHNPLPGAIFSKVKGVFMVKKGPSESEKGTWRVKKGPFNVLGSTLNSEQCLYQVFFCNNVIISVHNNY